MRCPAAGGVWAVLVLSLMGPASAGAHGDEAVPADEEAQIALLSEQPARILAQQALAELELSGDSEDAAMRLDAALESEDQTDIDRPFLMEATETLDGGDPVGAVPLLDAALSRPLGEEHGLALHAAGREFEPATGSPEVFGIVIGSILLLVGAWTLRPRRGTA